MPGVMTRLPPARPVTLSGAAPAPAVRADERKTPPVSGAPGTARARRSLPPKAPHAEKSAVADQSDVTAAAAAAPAAPCGT